MSMKKLFYDGSCRLCRHEIDWLRGRLESQLILVDISQPGFAGYMGATKQQMMQEIHLWEGSRFIRGLDATLTYWQMAGFGWLSRMMRTPPFYRLACWLYRKWADKRCAGGECQLREEP